MFINQLRWHQHVITYYSLFIGYGIRIGKDTNLGRFDDQKERHNVHRASRSSSSLHVTPFEQWQPARRRKCSFRSTFDTNRWFQINSKYVYSTKNCFTTGLNLISFNMTAWSVLELHLLHFTKYVLWRKKGKLYCRYSYYYTIHILTPISGRKRWRVSCCWQLITCSYQFDEFHFQVEWFWNGKPLRTGSRFRTFCDFGFVILEISPVYPEDSGEYSCRAINEYGEAVTSATMKVQGIWQFYSVLGKLLSYNTKILRATCESISMSNSWFFKWTLRSRRYVENLFPVKFLKWKTIGTLFQKKIIKHLESRFNTHHLVASFIIPFRRRM